MRGGGEAGEPLAVPLLLLAVTILGFVLTGNPAAQQAVVNSAMRNFPVIGDQIAGNVHSLHGNVTALVIGILASVYGGLGVTQAAISAMNQLWVVPVAERPGLGPTSLWVPRTVSRSLRCGTPPRSGAAIRPLRRDRLGGLIHEYVHVA